LPPSFNFLISCLNFSEKLPYLPLTAISNLEPRKATPPQPEFTEWRREISPVLHESQDGYTTLVAELRFELEFRGYQGEEVALPSFSFSRRREELISANTCFEMIHEPLTPFFEIRSKIRDTKCIVP
jgi:hypothetical protein